MTASQRQQDELSALTSIFSADELSVCGDGGVFRANVRTPETLVVTGTNGSRDTLRWLPPLSLHFTLPSGYPDVEPPGFVLAGHWLSLSRLSRLCRRLDALFEPGQEALFSWFGFLQDETWDFLALGDSLSLAALPGGEAVSQSQASEAIGSLETDQWQLGEAEGDRVNDQWRATDGEPRGKQEETKAVQTEDWDKEEREDWDKEEREDWDKEEREGWDKEEREDWDKEEREDWDKGDNVAARNGTKANKDRDGREAETTTTEVPVEAVDPRAMLEVAPSLHRLLLSHARAMAQAEFDRAAHECAVCLDTRLGAQSVRFEPCDHIVCRDCATVYLRQTSLRGAAVSCPGSECAAPFPHHVARSLLTEQEFLSYDSRLLESALSALSDIVRCPRAACQYAVTRDPADGKLATCFGCRYAFCVDCRQGYHGVEPCRFRPDEQRRLISEYRDGSSSERLALERRYGKRRLEALLESALTQSWLEDNSKPCPHCKAGIQKALGCNKMVCWRCNTHFCWLCATQLDPQVPYAHYLSAKSPCHRLLFQGVVPDDDNDNDLQAEGDIEFIEDLDRPHEDVL